MTHGIVFPQSIKTIPIEETAIGKQKYWYDLLLNDLTVGRKRLHNIFRFEETAKQITSSKHAMELIINGKTDEEDGKEVIIGGERNFSNSGNKLHYTVHSNEKQLVLTECIIENIDDSDTISASPYVSHLGETVYILRNQMIHANSTIKIPLHFVLNENDKIYISGHSSNNLKFTFKGKFVENSFLDIFLNNNKFVGQGITSYFDSSLGNLKQSNTINDITYSSLAMTDVCKDTRIMNFHEDNFGIDNLLNSEVVIAKWIAGRSGLNVSDFNTYVDIYNNKDLFLATEPKTPIDRYSPYDLIKEKIFRNENAINNIINSSDITDFSIMCDNQLLITTPFTQVGTGHSQYQQADYYRFYVSGSDTESQYANYYSIEMFDLTNINTITFDFDINWAEGTFYVYAGVYSNNTNSLSFSAHVNKTYNSDRNGEQFIVDVSSLTGKYYLKILLGDYSSSSRNRGYMYVKNITFKK